MPPSTRPIGAIADWLYGCLVQEVFRQVASDTGRTQALAAEIEDSFSQGLKILVLTERTDHLEAIGTALESRAGNLFTLHGRMTKKQRNHLIAYMGQTSARVPGNGLPNVRASRAFESIDDTLTKRKQRLQ